MTKAFRTNKHVSSALSALSRVMILTNGNNSLSSFQLDILVSSDFTPSCITLWAGKADGADTAHARSTLSALSACKIFVLSRSLGLNRCIFLLSAKLQKYKGRCAEIERLDCAADMLPAIE